jgi:nitric oxide reductase large subunit
VTIWANGWSNMKVEKNFKKHIMQLTSAALFISIALVIFGISYYYFTTRHKERMTILEKGLPPDYFKGNIAVLPFVLMLGIISIGIAMGLLTGTLLNALPIPGVSSDLKFVFSIFLCLGISLLVGYRVLKSQSGKR